MIRLSVLSEFLLILCCRSTESRIVEERGANLIRDLRWRGVAVSECENFVMVGFASRPKRLFE